MVKLKVNRFIQDPSCCAVAASTVVANYYDKSLNYKKAKEIAIKKVSKDVVNLGLESAEIGKLLNLLGFKKVEIITSNLDFLDYSWQNISKKKLIENLDTLKYKTKDRVVKSYCSLNCDFLKFSSKNKIIIDYNFGEYIREYLNNKIPVIVSFNWTKFFKFAKDGEKGGLDPFLGDITEHAVVAYGYNNKKVFICDSHIEYYKYKLKKYKNGFYEMSWENLMSVMGDGDIIIPSDFGD